MSIYYTQRSPFESNPERLVSEALAASQTPADIIRALSPPLPQIRLFPPRFGYGEKQDRIPTILEVLDVDRYYRNRRDDISGGPQSWQGSARNVQGSY